MGRAKPFICLVLWLIMVALLPVTSMPLVVRLVRSSTVAAPAGLVLFILVLPCFFPSLIKGISIHRSTLPLMGFVIYAIATTAVSNLGTIPGYKGHQPLQSQFEALLTLAIGTAFFILPAQYLRNKSWLNHTLQVINWSGLVVILWCGIQALSWYTQQGYPDWLRAIQEFFSVGPLYRQRVTGFTLEPSWLAHQLNMLYLPLWLAASASGYSSHRMLMKRVTFENLLLLGGAVVLFLTLSRVGLAAFILMLAYLALRISVGINKFVRQKLSNVWAGFGRLNKVRPGMSAALVYGIFVVLGLLAFSLLVAGISRFDPRMREMFTFNTLSENPLLDYANALTFSSRLVYWQAGWEIFNNHAWLGVGLGNAGFYMPQALSGFADRLVEVQALLFHSNTLLNIKSLWVRLLAETGIVGFTIFAAWLVTLWSTAKRLTTASAKLTKMMGLFGFFLLLGILIEGFSIDSFALPYIWFSFGMMTAGLAETG